MLDIQELQIIAQLIDNIENTVGNLEKSYTNNDMQKFKKAKNEILNFQQKIAKVLK